MQRLVVLISGQGSNLQALIDACAQPCAQARIVGVLSNRTDAFGLVRAEKAGIARQVIDHRDYDSRELYDAALSACIERWQADLIVLAGFMRILTPAFVARHEGRLINIHPSLLPRHKGLDTHARALAAHDPVHGCSVHWVSAELDGGPVIAQAMVEVAADDDAASLAAKVHRLEHRLYPMVIAQIVAALQNQEDPHALPVRHYRWGADDELHPG